MSLILSVLLPLAFIFFSARRLLSYLHFFQQEEYDSWRFLSWFVERRAFDKKLSLVLLPLVLLQISGIISSAVVLLIGAAVFFVFFFVEQDPRRQGKKPLVMTKRAQRIWWFALLFAIGAAVFVFFTQTIVVSLVALHALPFLLVLSVLVLSPYEKAVNLRFRNEAVAKLHQINPVIIGITGSFGKTSVKHILGHILRMYAPTLITPGSVNTEMGIVRIIREQLTPQHKYFVVEMGAYGVGSIARLCRLTPPKFGIITAIGHAHFERFRSLEETARAKFELAEAVIDGNGKIAVNADVLNNERARSFISDHPASLIVCGEGRECEIKDVRQLPTGLELTLRAFGKEHSIKTPLYGSHHAQNIALAFLAAMELGMAPEDIVSALVTTPQIAHRLEVKNMGESLLIDDAYNSNPQGFSAALELLNILKKDGRAILVTPGMVELGSAHDEEHARIGEHAARVVDILIAVVPDRIKALTEKFKERKKPEQLLLEVPTFAEAQAWISANVKPKDVILLENDLPDLYERNPKF